MKKNRVTSSALSPLRLMLAAIAVTPMLWQVLTLPVSSSCTPVSPTRRSLAGTRIRSDGATLFKGRPIFPFGLYHVSWYSTTDQLLTDMRAIAAGGFNTIHASAAYPESYGVVLDTAQSLGLNVITEAGTPDLATQYASRPAVLGWNIADDVDSGKNSPDAVAAQNAAVQAADPKHVSYISGYSQTLPNYVNSASVIGMQSYPLNLGTESEISSTYPQISILTNAVNGCNRSAYANLQAFSWGVAQPQISGLRAPTPIEARNMTYQAIAAGAKGILYYAYTDGTWNLPQKAPELWQGLQAMVPEMNTISPYLLNGKLTRLSTGQEKVFSGYWQVNQQAILVVVNASYQESSRVSLTLPTPVISQHFLFSDRPVSQSQPAANQLQLTLKPLSVLVYQMQL